MSGALSGARIALLADASIVHARLWGEALAERGATVRLFSLERLPPAAEAAAFEFRALPALPLPMALRYPAALPALRPALDEFAPHLVDAHFLPNYGVLAALAGHRPWVANAWGSDLLLARGTWRRARVRFVLERADRLFVDAEVARTHALSLGADPARVLLQPWGVDTERFAFGGGTEARRERRAEWPEAWRGDAPAAAWVSVSTRFLHPLYDVETAVRAWARFVEDHPDARLLVVGDGPEAASLRHTAAGLGLERRVRFLGRLAADDIARLLRDADFYLSTSRSDTTSISLLEAMSAGAFPVVSDLAANREWVGGETAEIFPPGDAEAMAKALGRAAARGEGLAAARAASRDRVVTEGSRARAMDRVAACYRELLADPPRPDSRRARPFVAR